MPHSDRVPADVAEAARSASRRARRRRDRWQAWADRAWRRRGDAWLAGRLRRARWWRQVEDLARRRVDVAERQMARWQPLLVADDSDRQPAG